MKIVFHPLVFTEIDAIMTYYEEIAEFALADRFFEDFSQTVRRVSENPQSFSNRAGDFRRANLRRFPFNLLFRDFPDHVRVLVLRHHSRNPKYGQERT
ncbi:MAG: type II toxin-antitoxin system RelE/ParE family toxin [Opitutales bacterium]|nr:type II toxin-antitoxin system RelE/ParE family toxin [Opitutales bacterium]